MLGASTVNLRLSIFAPQIQEVQSNDLRFKIQYKFHYFVVITNKSSLASAATFQDVYYVNFATVSANNASIMMKHALIIPSQFPNPCISPTTIPKSKLHSPCHQIHNKQEPNHEPSNHPVHPVSKPSHPPPPQPPTPQSPSQYHSLSSPLKCP